MLWWARSDNHSLAAFSFFLHAFSQATCALVGCEIAGGDRNDDKPHQLSRIIHGLRNKTTSTAFKKLLHKDFIQRREASREYTVCFAF